ncbi:glycine cleavage system aminomethyltransferase GcvT [Luteolibacter sp. SL250]|uniref:glycine cleavage system aminomethyltransferase GcvT n=1 Tax=Luteolibacter sp. SL250 TaxID=2995170 RepID=UPI002271F3F2|nr:glycine cleavage system aminomethyltransferase GcvT [Luteolibacter sp. SL250]WAC21810.1 glycine cleavage system aminomethyltransferase GcvT [Luteolibacter sp. SL250]
MNEEDLKRTPLEANHEALGARMVPFGGWYMPVQYTSILSEHAAVREKAGIFDISHMGQFIVGGPGAATWLQKMLTNNIGALEIGQGQYTLMLNERGGVIDDLIVYRTGENDFFLVVNASMIDEDYEWFIRFQPEDAAIRNESGFWAGLAIQGPLSQEIYAKVLPGEPLPARNGIHRTEGNLVICRTGYTGEDGFEFFCPAAEAGEWWDKFIAAGVVPCGLGSRDTLRLEMGYPLNGNDLSPTRTPIEAGLGFFVDLTKDFTGRDILAAQKEAGPAHKLVGIRYLEKGAPPRAHYPVTTENGTVIGELASGALSPSLMTGIGMAYLPVEHSKPGTLLNIDIRGRLTPAKVVKKPFYKPVKSSS